MKTVLIEIMSSAIGDTIAAVPYVSEYQKQKNYKVFFKINESFISLLEDVYTNIYFIDKKSDIEFDEKISLDYVFHKSVQGGFAEQLGFENPKYIRPVVSIPEMPRPIKNKYISMGVHSTSQLKYWNHPDGEKSQLLSPNWNDLSSRLRKLGYTPVVVERDESFGVPPFFNHVPIKSNNKIGQSLIESMNFIYHSEFYIGLSSGMSWLAHAMGKKVVMISNFTEDWNEFDLSLDDYIRITNKSVCHGCFNKVDKEFTFNASDWYWCPLYKGTDRQFECHTSITVDDVMEKIKLWL